MQSKKLEKVILRAPDVMELYGISRSTLYARVRDGSIPAPVKISERAIGWPALEINAVLAARIGGQNSSAIKRLVQRLNISRAAFAESILGGENNVAETSTIG